MCVKIVVYSQNHLFNVHFVCLVVCFMILTQQRQNSDFRTLQSVPLYLDDHWTSKSLKYLCLVYLTTLSVGKSV